MRLAQKLTALATVPMAVLVGATAWIATESAEEQLLEEIEAGARAELELRSVTLDQYLRHRFDELERTARNPIYTSAGDVAKLEHLSARAETLSSSFESLYLDDLDGNVIGADGSRFNVRDRPYFERILLGERVVSSALKSRASGRWIVVMTVPLSDASGTLAGAIAGTIPVEALVRAASLSPPRLSGFAVLLESSGAVLSSDGLPEHADERALEVAASVDRGTAWLDETPYLVYSGSGPVEHWRLVIGYPERAVLARSRNLRTATLFAALAAVLLSALIAVVVARRMARPVSALVDAHERVRAGDLRARVHVGAGDEIGDIARSFNRMVEQLHDEATRREEAEEALHRAQRLESVGLLAGGVAHDFNNLLTAILANAEFARDDNQDPRVAKSLDEIIASTLHGADLTRQLLGFARRQPHRPIEMDLAHLVEAVEPLLSRVLPKSIRLIIERAGEPCGARVDLGQLQQVLLNLVINARDAIDGDGEIRLKVAPDGEEVVLLVRDDGGGIQPDALPRIFDPFFSTKDPTRGTGLGLAMVHGIVEQHGGRIDVQSRPGQTVFELRLPRVSLDAATVARRSPEREPYRGPVRHVLLAEDDPAVQRVTVEGLRRLGFSVDVAADGEEALERFARDPTRFGALVTDIVMPRMSGTALSARVRELRPDLPIVLVSGYDDRLSEAEARLEHSVLVMKPVSPRAIADALFALVHAPE